MNLNNRKTLKAVYWSLFLIIALSCYWLRTVGQNWDEGQGLHPDERFVLMVAGSIETVKSLSEYFDTANSTLNPHNKNFGFYVYGTAPLYLMRLLGDYFKTTPMDLLSRQISAVFDCFSALLVFVISWILFGRWAGLIGFFLYSVSVLPVQLSHFGTFDIHGTFFICLNLLLAVLIARLPVYDKEKSDSVKLISSRNFYYIGFLSICSGIVCGLATATKINLLAVFGLIPLSIFYSNFRKELLRSTVLALSLSFLALCCAFFSFRFFQPMAFLGPDFFGFSPNPKWIANIKELLAQSAPTVHFPPAVQWIDRGRLHAFLNILNWGLGLPLGLLALCSWVYAAARIVRKKDFRWILPLVWTVVGLAFFTFMPLAQAMRYSLPVFPAIAVLLAGFTASLLSAEPAWLVSGWRSWEKVLVRTVIFSIFLFTLFWALAFTSIYRNPNPRISASRWLLNNVPGAVNFEVSSAQRSKHIAVPVAGEQASLSLPHELSFSPGKNFNSKEIFIPKISPKDSGLFIDAVIFENGNEIARGRLAASQADGLIQLNNSVNFKKGATYNIVLNSSVPGTRIYKLNLGKETSWDDGLPQRIDGTDPFGGLYNGETNLEIYWTDFHTKPERLARALSESDYFYLSSNRQVGSVGRLPRFFPVAAMFYQKLLGCSAREYIPQCYAGAEVGQRMGELGFELVSTFESYPRLFGWEFNDQLADESFSVYDHPKVLIFKNSSRLNTEELRRLLTPVGLKGSDELG